MTAPQAAPPAGWLRALVRVNRAPIPWDRVVLTSIGIAAPVGLALALAPHDAAVIGAGSLASMGALVASVLDTGSAGVDRVHRMTLASILGSLGFALGTLVYGHAALTLVAVVAATFISGLAGTISAAASKSALFFLMFVVTAANAEFGLASAWAGPLLFFIGAIWRTMMTVVSTTLSERVLSPERHAVAAVYAAVADQLSAAPGEAADVAAARLTVALNAAYDEMAAERTASTARRPRWGSLVRLLNASAPMVDAAIAMEAGGEVADPEAVAYLHAVARWIMAPSEPVPPPPVVIGRTPARAALAASVLGVVRVIAAIDERGTPASPDDIRPLLPLKLTVRERLTRAGRSLVTGTQTWSAVLRLALCMAVAQAATLLLHLDHAYLVMLTVAQVMKPDFGSVFARAVQRAGGTLLGVVIGSVVLSVVPVGGWQILVIAVLAAGIPIAMPRNYGLYALVTTPLAVILVEVHAGPSAQLVESRLADTVLGCAIVLVVGYLPWPSTWHAPRHLAAGVAELVQAVARYLAMALGSPAGEHPDRMTSAAVVPAAQDDARTAARRGIYRMLSDLRTAIAQSLSEPPPVGVAAASWEPEVAALGRVTDAITATATTAAASGVAIDAADVAIVESALIDLADAVSAGRMPSAAELPHSGPLAGVCAEIRTARAALCSVRWVRRPGRPAGSSVRRTAPS